MKIILFGERRYDIHKEFSTIKDIELHCPNTELDIYDAHKAIGADVIIFPFKTRMIDSLQLLRDLRHMDSQVKIIIIMSIKNPQSCIEYLAYGANEIIIKPLTAHKILLKIEEMVKKKIQ